MSERLSDANLRCLAAWGTSDQASMAEELLEGRAHLDYIAKVVKEAAEHVESICPRPGPYHPAFAALIGLADSIKFVPRGPGGNL